MMTGQTISHYKIHEKLGEGGMGVVYRAEDLKLKRIVALKFLPHHLSRTPEEEARFLQEAQAAATLNHPNVCTIYDIAQEGDQQFIVMEYIEGVTLRRKLSAGPLPLEQAVGYVLQIGDALHDAHAKGIVHRDVKPDNIMVNTKNTIKVMDFGLAKLKGSLKLTRTSSTVGTLAYMAPEQIQGGATDARSDIFSFGVVLFEMLTGRLPFRGDHEAALMYSIVNEEPESLSSSLPDAPPELLHVISRALDKDPEDRYQSVHDMVIDLRRLKKESTKVSRASMPALGLPGAAEPAPARRLSPRTRVVILAAVIVAVAAGGYLLFFANKGAGDGERLHVAVADFVNETGEKELDGLSGMLITALEQSRRLSVLTRSRMLDVLKAAGNANVERIDENLGKTICTQANIGALVTASIRKFGKLYSVDLKILDVRRNEYLFTAKEEGEGQENIPAMLDRLAEKTREGLKDQAGAAPTAKLAAVTTSNMEAYQHYFQGEGLIDRLKFDDAQKEFRRAIELDSTFGLAWYRLAYTLTWGLDRTKASARGVIDKALQLSDRIPEKERYLLRGVDAEQRGSYPEAVGILREMETHYPDDKEMLYNIGDWSFHAGDFATAETYLRKVLAIDPHHDRALQHLAWTYRSLRDYEKMADAARSYVASSGSVEAYFLLRDAYVALGQNDQALRTLQSARELFPKRYPLTRTIADLYVIKGEYAKAEGELRALLDSSKPPAARRVAYAGLASYSFLLGKVRDVRRFTDGYLAIAREQHDTSAVCSMSILPAIVDIVARKDPAAARRDLAAVFPSISGYITGRFGTWDYAYALLGDLEALDTLLRESETVPLQLLHAVAYSVRHDCSRGETLLDSASAMGLPDVITVGPLYNLARCQYESGQTAKALATAQKLLANKELPQMPEYPLALVLLGNIYEARGDAKQALPYYEKFLTLWKDADRDLPDYVDVGARIAKLKRTAAP